MSMISWIFILYFRSQSNASLFCCSNCSSFGSWELFQGPLSPWHRPSLYYLSTSIFSGSTRSSWLILCISCSSSRISHFNSILGNGVRKQDLDARCAHHSWGVMASRSLQLSEEENTCGYTNLWLSHGCHLQIWICTACGPIGWAKQSQWQPQNSHSIPLIQSCLIPSLVSEHLLSVGHCCKHWRCTTNL